MAAAPALRWSAVIEVACLAIYAAVVVVFGPMVLRVLTNGGYAPRIGVGVWLTAAVSVLAAWCMAGIHALRHGSPPVRLLAAVVLGVLFARVCWTAGSLVRSTMRRRREHGLVLMLVGRRDADLDAMVVTAPQRLVYCMPSGSGLVVVTTGAQAALSTEELGAALAHERAHLSGRHHLIMTVGHALSRIAPWLPLLRMLGERVTVLLEMRADDHAGSLHGRQTVARAIAALSVHAVPTGALGAGAVGPTARVRRLRSPLSAWRRRMAVVGAAATVAFLAVGPYLATIDPWCSRYHL